MCCESEARLEERILTRKYSRRLVEFVWAHVDSAAGTWGWGGIYLDIRDFPEWTPNDDFVYVCPFCGQSYEPDTDSEYEHKWCNPRYNRQQVAPIKLGDNEVPF